ncbi:MAG: lysophospholipid acyltransferase family protein [Bacteroidota bacterium]
MKFLSPLLYYLIIFPVSLLPFPLLYGLSDLLFIIFYHLVPYRKKLVLENLRRSFPEKTESELKKIRREFYRHFGDLIVESIKTFTASRKAIVARVELVNADLVESFYEKGKSVILVTGHYANWEWPALTLPFVSSHTATGIYKKLTDPFFDRLLQKSRSRFGLNLMSTREVQGFFKDHTDELCTYGFINDQSPSDPRRGHWMTFLNQDTCVLMGVETYARKYDLPVVYVDIRKASRGKYRLTYRLVTDAPLSTAEYRITEDCARINESIIREAPAYWLWTHRRWKHRRPS